MHFEKVIFENDALKLMINYSWITGDCAVAEDLKLSIYAFSKKTFSQIFFETLNIEQVRGLFHHLNSISLVNQGKERTGKFIETTDELLNIINWFESFEPQILREVLEKIDVENKFKVLLDILTEVDIQNLSAAYKQKSYLQEIQNLEVLLQLEDDGDIVNKIKEYSILETYVAGQPEKIFQNWLEKNLWVFGVEYVKKHDYRKIALFSEADILLESIDGFLDLIELKRPKVGRWIFKYDKSHDSYYPSNELSEVIWQCLFYLQKMSELKLNLEKEYKVKILYPRIKILIWRTIDFTEDEYTALKMLNSHLHCIQIVSYDYILSCGKKVLAHFWSEF